MAEFKETHLGPLKNPLGSRTTSTSTIKNETPEPTEDKLSSNSSNDIGMRTMSGPDILADVA